MSVVVVVVCRHYVWGGSRMMMIREGVDKLVEAEEGYEESNVQI